jgi:hypothetical protein
MVSMQTLCGPSATKRCHLGKPYHLVEHAHRANERSRVPLHLHRVEPGDVTEITHCLALGPRRVARHVPGPAQGTFVARHGDQQVCDVGGRGPRVQGTCALHYRDVPPGEQSRDDRPGGSGLHFHVVRPSHLGGAHAARVVGGEDIAPQLDAGGSFSGPVRRAEGPASSGGERPVGLPNIEIRPTHRVHTHAQAAVIRASTDPAEARSPIGSAGGESLVPRARIALRAKERRLGTGRP